MRGNRYFFSQREGNQNQPVIYWREGYKGETTTLLDPATIDAVGPHDGRVVLAADGRQALAYGTYRAGDENTTLHLMEVDTGKVLPFEIPNKTQAPDWLPDGSGFVYQNLEESEGSVQRPGAVPPHGHRSGEDPVLFRQFTKEENEKLATTWGPFGTLSRDGQWLVLGYGTSTRSERPLARRTSTAWRETGKLEKTRGHGGRRRRGLRRRSSTARSSCRRPRARRTGASWPWTRTNPAKSAWSELVPERKDAVIESVSFARGVLAVEYLKNAANSIEVFGFDGRPAGELKLPGIGSAALAAEQDRTEAYLTFTSFNYPTTIFRVDLATPARRARALGAPGGAGRPATSR